MRGILFSSILVFLISGAASANVLSDALDTNLIINTGGDKDWFVQSANYFNDGDAARSGAILHNQKSWMQTTVNGAGILSFYWKVSSEAGYDFLEFYIDGVLQDRISGSEDWQRMLYTITGSGLHTLDLRYVKDKSVSSGSDSGWVDQLEWSGEIQPPSGGPLSEALDTSLNFITDGDAEWFLQSDMAYFDGDAAQSGAILDNQESLIRTLISGTGTFSFYWKVTSEADYDFLEFYIDGVLQDRISGTMDWHQKMYSIYGSVMHTLEWRYVKDYSISEGGDSGWVDLVEWSGGSQPPVGGPLSEALDTSLSFAAAGDADWFSQTAIAYFDGDAAQSGDVLDNQESLVQTTVSGAGTVSFFWKVSSEAGYDFLEFYIDGVLQDIITGSVGWHKMMYIITGSGSHTLKWRYVKDFSVSEGDDSGWVDKVEWSGTSQPPSSGSLSEALDTTLSVSTGGDADWFSQTRPYYFDYDAAQSGDIGDGQVSWMQTTIYGSGTLSFYWKVSSDRDGDDLQFFIDGVLQNHILETVDWHQMTYEITASGLHTLEWRYVQDYSVSDGDDNGYVWVDQLEWLSGDWGDWWVEIR